ncbi:hypothetical protein GCM10020229_76490 [Kitasatospora albolonga]
MLDRPARPPAHRPEQPVGTREFGPTQHESTGSPSSAAILAERRTDRAAPVPGRRGPPEAGCRGPAVAARPVTTADRAGRTAQEDLTRNDCVVDRGVALRLLRDWDFNHGV